MALPWPGGFDGFSGEMGTLVNLLVVPFCLFFMFRICLHLHLSKKKCAQRKSARFNQKTCKVPRTARGVVLLVWAKDGKGAGCV